MKALITRKLGMTSTIAEDGVVQAVTLLAVAEHTVLHHKTIDKDGYTAVQVGTETAKKLSKSVAGHVKAAKVMPKIIREFRLNDIPEELNVGSKISADVFSVGDTVMPLALLKVRAGLAPSAAITSIAAVRLTAAVLTAARARSARCTRSTFSKALGWLANWVTTKSPCAT